MIFYLILKLKRKEKNPQQYSFGKFILKNGKRLRLTTFSYLFIFKLMKKNAIVSILMFLVPITREIKHSFFSNQIKTMIFPKIKAFYKFAKFLLVLSFLY